MKSYLTFLKRNKLYTAIEAVGLIVSIAFVILIGSYVWQQLAVTRENPDRKRIYTAGIALEPALPFNFLDYARERIPEIEMSAKISTELVSLKIGHEDPIDDLVVGIDKSFFDICPYYRFVEGSADGLQALSNVVVGQSYAEKHDLKLGSTIICNDNAYTVCGIVQDFEHTLMPKSYQLFFNSKVFEMIFGTDVWRLNAVPLMKVQPDVQREVLHEKLESLCKELYPEEWGVGYFEHLELTRYDELFFKNTNTWFAHGDKPTLVILMVVGFLLLLSAIFNYVNLSVALTGKRAKEMAVRRLSGATKGMIVWRYIVESIAFTAVCFVLGWLLAYALCPTLNYLLNNPEISIMVMKTPKYILAYVIVILLVGTISGVIPAVLAGKFKPIDVVKGTYRRHSKMVLSKVFIVFQNALAVILIAMAIVMEAQMRKSEERPLHANISNLFYLSHFDYGPQTSLHDALETLPFVSRMGRSYGAPGTFEHFREYVYNREGQEVFYRCYIMDSTAFSLFDIEVVEDYGMPVYNGLWLSEEAYAAAGFDSAYSDISNFKEVLRCDHLAGVFKSFPDGNSNMGVEVPAIILMKRPENNGAGAWVMEIVGDKAEAANEIRRVNKENAPEGSNVEFDNAFYIEDNLAESLQPARNNMRLMEIFMLLSILISLLGLLAMSTYYIDERSHDIAVRKVFGGTVASETLSNIKEYMLLVLVANIIGIPVAVWLAGEYLKQFIYKLTNYWWIFVVAVVLSVLIAFLSVLWQTLKAARTNPVIELKKE